MTIIKSLASLRSPWGTGLLILLLASSLCSATAQSSVDELTELPVEELLRVEVLKVYGASRYEQKALEAPANVSVITAEDIRRYGYRHIGELLNSVAGLYLNYDGGYHYLGYRGFSLPGDYNTRVLMLLDGVRLNDAVYHQAPAGYDFPLDISLVERVEVIRGPSQAIYGNNAFLLVINVVTRPVVGGNGAEFDLYTDTLGQSKGTATVAGRPWGMLGGLLLSGSLFNAIGSERYFPAYDHPDTANGISRAGADALYGGRLYVKYEQERLTFSGGYQRGRKQIPTAYWGTIFNDLGTYGVDERYFINLGYRLLEGEQGSLQWRSYLNGSNFDGSYAYNPVPETDYSRALTLGSELVGTLRLPGRQQVVAGLDYRYGAVVEQGDSHGYHDRRSVQNVGLFLQDEYRPVTELILFGGLRYDYLDGGLHTVNPKAGVVWLPLQGLACKYLFGRSFRAPNAFERFYQGSGYRANQTLKEETLLSHELIVEYQLDERLRTTVTGFQYTYDNLISQLANSDGTYSFFNLERYRTKGIEGELAFKLNGWSGSIGYTWQQTRSLVHNDDPVINSPDHLFKVRLSRELLGPKLILSGELQYISRLLTADPAVHAGDLPLFNLSLLSRDLILKGLDGSLTIYNLLDRRYGLPASQVHLPVALMPQDGLHAGFRLSYHF